MLQFVVVKTAAGHSVVDYFCSYTGFHVYALDKIIKDCPLGIHIWRGDYSIQSSCSYIFKGKFDKLTLEETNKVRNSINPLSVEIPFIAFISNNKIGSSIVQCTNLDESLTSRFRSHLNTGRETIYTAISQHLRKDSPIIPHLAIWEGTFYYNADKDYVFEGDHRPLTSDEFLSLLTGKNVL